MPRMQGCPFIWFSRRIRKTGLRTHAAPRAANYMYELVQFAYAPARRP
jgi:hypothetical protein